MNDTSTGWLCGAPDVSEALVNNEAHYTDSGQCVSELYHEEKLMDMSHYHLTLIVLSFPEKTPPVLCK